MTRRRSVLLLSWCIAVALIWAATIASTGGLFAGSLSVDFRSFWAATQAFLTIGPAAAYDMPTLARIVQGLAGQGGAVAGNLVAAPAPYPPPFFLIFAPFALLPPTWGFALWTAFNLVLAACAVWPLVRGARASWLALGAALLFFPLTFSLYAGQPSGLLLFGLYQMYQSLREERDLRAGLWLGVLLLKPQYAVGLALVLLLKRRWSALAGLSVAGVLLAVASLALVGLKGLLAYRVLLSSVAGYRSAPAGIAPNIMISWRGFLLNVLPGLPDHAGLLLTLVLSGLTLMCLPVLWRGSWRPRDGGFEYRIIATLVVTLLVAYHSHIYGATLLLVPGAQLATTGARGSTRLLLLLGLLAPPVVLFLTGSTIAVALLLVVLMTATLAAIVVECNAGWRRRHVSSAGTALAGVVPARKVV